MAPLPLDEQGSSIESERPTEFVGSTTCAECHPDQHESFARTTHSKSLSLVDPELEPPDAEFVYELSGCNYEVYRDEGQLRHREALLSPDGETIAQSDYPVKYLVGSGAHTRTYLSEINGFLVESPITWYESRREWDVSPGYDVPFPPGFERPADIGCLACHIGSAEEVEGSLHRIRFHELAIGCERCHGPGREHVDAAKSDREEDVVRSTIVNPGLLSKTLSEDICAQCHLRGDATAYLAGMGPMDFRPGAPLTSVRIDYSVDTSHDQMKVVGHVEQMRLSRCYTQSGELTCITCHDMHAEDPPAGSTAQFYRSRCLDCHNLVDCNLPEDGEQRMAEQDNCVTCHMPQSDTDIPHIAFTHHRIGVHTQQAEPGVTHDGLPHLVAHQDVSTLDPGVIQRAEGLAYRELSGLQPSERLYGHCFTESMRRLETAYQQGATDGDLEAALAQYLLHSDPGRAAAFADAALERDALRAESRINALLVRGFTYRSMGRPDVAIASFEELLTVRRFAMDSLMLGNWRQATDPNGALEDLRSASEIQPLRADFAAALAEALARMGHFEEAEDQRRRAEVLQQYFAETNAASDGR